MLFKVPAGVIETLFNEQKQVPIKWANSEEQLYIGKPKGNFKGPPSHYIWTTPELLSAYLTKVWPGIVGGGKILNDIFIYLDGPIDHCII